MVEPITTYVAQKRISWYGHVTRRDEYCKGSNNDEGGMEDTSGKAQTDVDGQSAERFETPARSKSRTKPRSTEKGSHGDRPRTWIRSANVSG